MSASNLAKTDEHTAAFKIFHYIFICQMSAMHLYSDEELEHYEASAAVTASLTRLWPLISPRCS